MLRILKSKQIVMVNDRAPGKHIARLIRIQRVTKLFPVDKIVAHGVSPVHISPVEPDRIVLEERVPAPLVIHKPVRVIQPSRLRRQVDRRSHRIIRQSGLFFAEAKALSRFMDNLDVESLEA